MSPWLIHLHAVSLTLGSGHAAARRFGNISHDYRSVQMELERAAWASFAGADAGPGTVLSRFDSSRKKN
jgi:hypothetical protein